MFDVKKMLAEVCENDCAMNDDCELIDSGLLDSLAMIELFSRLEDEGITIHLTQIDRTRLKTTASVIALIEEYTNRETE